ncbi:MAG: ATP-dependent Clp protease ATP-binding subunit ClpA, partial [Treponema sp.]|nr:ATP-dependent Clp protease ATP-binding subunit ClpA [Treponema sp.]
MKISGHVQTVINAAFHEAKIRNHEYLTPEHILFAAMAFDEVKEILSACGADLGQLRKGMENFFEEKIPVIAGADPVQTDNFSRVIERAVLSSQSAQKESLEISDILVSLYDEERNFCSYFLRKAGVRRLDLLNIISHGFGSEETAGGFTKSGRPPENNEDALRDTMLDDEIQEPGAKGRVSKKSALEKYATELTALARDNRLEPV